MAEVGKQDPSANVTWADIAQVIQNIDSEVPPLVGNPSVKLTRREHELLLLMCQDKTTEEIAQELHISIRTVETQRLNLKKKVGAKGYAGIILYALHNNILKLNGNVTDGN